jgi:hypothetical protein
MPRKTPNVHQHESLRIPSDWKTQDRAFAMQIERIFDDIYNRLGNIRYKDLSDELKARLPSNETSP